MDKRLLYLLGFVIICLGVYFTSVDSPTGYSVKDNDLRVVSVDEWVLASENGVILDIRTKEEYDVYHIPGSINIDFYSDDFLNKLEELDRDEAYFTYCRTGRRSGIALDSFRELGFKSVYDLKGGVVEYKNYLEKEGNKK